LPSAFAELQQHSAQLQLAALPLVGEGRAYTHLGIPILAVQTIPSSLHIHGRAAAGTRFGSGLLQLTLAQLKAVRSWAKLVGYLQLGRYVPLLFAWLSGATYAFVGTAKSNTTCAMKPVRCHGKRRCSVGRLVGFRLPPERWLMSRPHCQGVFPRDSLTTETLQNGQFQLSIWETQ